jgi:SAM-dependent methyltransferase
MSAPSHSVIAKSKVFAKQYPVFWHFIKATAAKIKDPMLRLRGKPPARIPRNLWSQFNMNGQATIRYGHADGSRSNQLVYDRFTIDAVSSRVSAGELGHYGAIDSWLHAALKSHPIRDQQVAIMGSADQGFGPWYECICLYHGGAPTTIDYNPIDFRDSRIRFIKAPIDHSIEQFDAALSISSFEHDGLGRYGEPLDPQGDLKAMRQMKQLLRKDGKLFLAVPLGKDKVVFNVHRIYGRARLPLLLDGWTVMQCFGFQDALLDRDTGYGWNPTSVVRGPRGLKEEFLHPEYPEYSPVWVLRNT